MSDIKDGVAQASVGQLVSDDFRRASVFTSFSIDYCCGGKKTLEQVCNENGLSIDDVVLALNEVELQAAGPKIDYRAWKLDFLCDYIENTHHAYVGKAIPELIMNLEKLTHAHGGSHQELWEIKSCFEQLAGELTAHMKKEEILLFPHIKKLVLAQQHNQEISPPPFGSIQNPIDAMEADHEGAGEVLTRIRSLSDDFTMPADGCMTYRVTMERLLHFEEDLHQHIHLENNILFPSAIKLEREIFANK